MDQPSAFVKSIEGELQSERERLSRANTVAKWCAELKNSELPPVPYMNKIGSNGPEHFKSAMGDMFLELCKRFRLSPQSKVLDLGCGCGRLAFPFSEYLDEDGTYYGIDVWEDGIRYCRDRFIKPNMNFTCVESGNNYYFENIDHNINNDYNINDIRDNSLDLVYAFSVLTHLTERDCLSYMSEIRRTLKETSGFGFLTCFIIDEYFFHYVEQTGKHKAVRKHSHGVYHAYSGQDFFAGFTLDHWKHMLGVTGLKIISFELGSWAHKPSSRVFQDSFVVAAI